MKPLFPYPVTTPPTKPGNYLTVDKSGAKDFSYFNGTSWYLSEYPEEQYVPEYYMSESMPPELAEEIDNLKASLQHITTDCGFKTVEIFEKTAQTILKYLWKDGNN